MRLRAIRLLEAGLLLCLAAAPLAAGPGSGRISGVVVDPFGTPQMGATVLVSSEQLLGISSLQLLTNDRGRFSTSALPPGLYSVKVTLAGFLPALESHIQVDDQHAATLQIVLASIFSSFEKLRRPSGEQVPDDEWTWVLRTSPATRPVLRWQDEDPALDAALGGSSDATQPPSARGRLALTSGADRPGSVSAQASAPTTAFAYDLGLGAKGQLLMAGEFGYDDASASGGVAAAWLPSGQPGVGPVTTILVRESRLDPAGPAFRGLRMSHDDEFALGDLVTIRYGAEYLVAGLGRETSALRPRGQVTLALAPQWRASLIVAAQPWQNIPPTDDALETAFKTLDAFPTLLVRDGRPVLENGWHGEFAVEHPLNSHADLSAAVFRDLSSHTAVIGRGAMGGPDFLQDYFSEAFAYDGGASHSTGARVAYRQKISDHLTTTVVYAYAGALTPLDDRTAAALRAELVTRQRQSLAARVSTTVPRLGTQLSAGYKWLNGPVVSRLDSYGESIYHLDPYLSLEVRQPLPNLLPCRVEVQADIGNLLAQGYVPVATADGALILVPSYRYFRGGLNLQF